MAKSTDDTQKTRLEASVAQYRTTYSSLLANAQQAKLAEAQATNNLVVAEPADVPEAPVRPRTLTNTLLAAVIGAMLAVGAAFLIEYLDDTIKTRGRHRPGHGPVDARRHRPSEGGRRHPAS